MPSIPPATAAIWERLATGQVVHKFGLFAANMAVTQAIRTIKGDPARKAAVIADLHGFFERYATQTAADVQRLN